MTLPADRIPTHWINLLTDLLILQEVSAQPEVEIPEPVREALKLCRPTPLHRARRLERELDTPARIYYK